MKLKLGKRLELYLHKDVIGGSWDNNLFYFSWKYFFFWLFTTNRFRQNLVAKKHNLVLMEDSDNFAKKHIERLTRDSNENT